MAPPTPSRQASHLSGAKDAGGAREAAKTHKPRTRRSCFSGHGVISAASQVTDVEVYYGTMFGSAERYARALAHEVAVQRRARVVVHDLDAFDEATFARRDRLVPSRLFVFVVSTHFAGAPSPSAERFRDWINYLVDNPRATVDAKTRASDRTATQVAMTTGLQSMWPFQRRRGPVKNMQYAVFGVGDSMYLTYNAMGKLVDHKLKELGATRFHQLGLGDSSNDIETTFRDWQAALLAKLPRYTAEQSFRSSSAMVSPDKNHAVTPVSEGTSTVMTDDDPSNRRTKTPAIETPIQVVDHFGSTVSLGFQCRVLSDDEVASAGQLYTLYPRTSFARSAGSNDRAQLVSRTPRIALFDPVPFADIEAVEIRPDYGADRTTRRAACFCVHFRSPVTTYISVSTLAVFPENDPDYVAHVAEAFGYDLNAVIELAQLSSDDSDLQSQLPFPTPCTVRTALTEFLELRTLTREFIRVAAGFVVTSDERAMLEHLASTEGTTAFRTQIVEQFKGILDLITMAPTLQIPLEVFVNITPPIKPRFYSIGSSPRVSPHGVDIAVSLGVANQPQGLTVSYFERILSLPQGTRVPMRGFVSWSRFQFPDDGVSPMVMIAMGVGLSAMRSIIQERLSRRVEAQRTSSLVVDKGGAYRSGNRTLPSSLPTLILFLGVRSKEHIVFSNDLNHWEQQMVVKVHYTFSNDPRHARRRVYDSVAARMDEIVDTVRSSNGSRVFVCGRVNLLRRIRELFEADQARRGNRWFDAVQSGGRFIEEGFN